MWIEYFFVEKDSCEWETSDYNHDFGGQILVAKFWQGILFIWDRLLIEDTF